MKFINRKKELKQLGEYKWLSKKGLIVLAIAGLRRVGKTTLVKEFIKDKKAIYFFVYESKTSFALLNEFTQELRKKKIITDLENIDSWILFFDIIFKRCENYTIVFDEFQNFYSIDPSVFSIMQKTCDENKNASINIIILGSLIGLFRKIFEDKKQALYGRISAKIKLDPFSLKDSIETMNFLGLTNIKEMLKLYSLFGGFPKYYAAIEQFDLTKKNALEIIEYLFVQENAPLENEVIDILKQEFGRRSPVYYSLLSAIVNGKTKLSEIASTVKMKESSITRHLSELEEKFGLVKATKPIGSKRNTRYFLSHPLIIFWFRFIYNKFSEYKLRDTKQLMKDINKDLNSFFGRRFEEISKEFLIELNKENKIDIKMDSIINWWGSKRVNDEREEIEIDLIATEKESKKILFAECKWKDNVNPWEIVRECSEKAKFVEWNKKNRKESFALFAKSFKNKINEFEGKKVYCFDLKDIEKELKK